MQFLIRSLGVLIKFFIVRLSVALGLSVVSFAGYAIALNWLADVVANEVLALPNDILQMLLIAGVGEGLGYLFGGFMFRVTMATMSKLTFIPGD